MDKYTKVKKIGEGSFGKALLVKSKEDGKHLVVKEINMSRMSRKEREEARKETSVLAQLQHPSIVSYKESFEEIGNLYIVMDYCDGGDLYGRINSQKGMLFTEEQILNWFVQTCLAIKHIHDRKILHRDIKSQNIFLTRHGIVKLGDFGIAKVLNSTVELARTCIGTPYYLSPEICENKPYNNKSDVWSLGCVLYELSTLKHAFEAGNMKNLVLKIIRGSYPPPPSRYSYDLRSLISQLFKRNPRDRPSINSVLKKPLLQKRIQNFLSDSEVASEFSHTVMHGVQIKKNIPRGGPRPLPPKPVQAKKPPTPVQTPRYNPASAYAPSVARKSASKDNKKPVDVRQSAVKKQGNVFVSPRPVPVLNPDINRRRQELVEKERKRREEAKNKEAQYAKQHRDLVEKQRVSRMQRAREEGWRNLVDSLGSEDSDKKGAVVNGADKKDVKKPSPRSDDASAMQPASPSPSAAAGKERQSYEHYHAFLDKLDQERKAMAAPKPAANNLGVAGAFGYDAAPEPVPSPSVARPSPSPSPIPAFDPIKAARQGQAAGHRASEAAGRARVVEDFYSRKEAAAHNKARGQGDLYGARDAITPRPHSAAKANVKGPEPTPSAGRPQSRDADRYESQQDYLNRLKQIRQQNFQERRNYKDQASGGRVDPKFKPPVAPVDNEARRKKLDALRRKEKILQTLRMQAEERAKKLKADLEKKRKEAYDLEQRRLREQGGVHRHQPVLKPSVAAKPDKPPMKMTDALRNIGVVKEEPKVQMDKCSIGMTAAMQAIGANPSETEPSDTPRTSLQKKKNEILKRLNAKPTKSAEKEDEKPAEKAERPKWGEPVKPDIAPERPKWGAGNVQALGQISLEETASHMEATNVGDVVVKHTGEAAASQPTTDDGSPSSARRQWGGRPGTVISIFQQAEVEAGTTTLPVATTKGEVAAPEAASSPPVVSTASSTITVTKEEVTESGNAPSIGRTITISHVPNHGTVIIPKVAEPTQADERKSESKEPQKERIQRSRSPSPPPKSTPVSDNEAQSNRKSDDGEIVKLFDRVELEEDDDEGGRAMEDDLQVEEMEDDQQEVKTKDEVPSQEKLKRSEGTMVLGLTTGHFDVDVQLLRTCSEPDLGKLFRTLNHDTLFDVEPASLNVSLIDALEELDDDDLEPGQFDLDTEEDDRSASPGEVPVPSEEAVTDKQTAKQQDKTPTGVSVSKSIDDLKVGEALVAGSSNDDEVAEDGDMEPQEEEQGEEESDEDDLETMRESMMSLLLHDDKEEDDDEPPISARAPKKVKKGKKGKKVKRKKGKDTVEKESSPNWSDSSVEDFKSLRATMKGLLELTPAKSAALKKTLQPVSEVGAAGDASKVEAEPAGNQVAGSESWQSDDDIDDDYWEEEDMFSRLEASRAKLESELGCDTFLKAYKTVQMAVKAAIHEDEDENMEEGIRLVTDILGEAKVNLYPSILQLVMADGAFTEDND